MSDFMRFVKTLALGIMLGVAGPSLHAQATPAATAAKPAPQPQAKPAAQVPAKTGAPAATPQAKPAAKPATQAANPPQATKPAATKPATAKPASAKPAAKKPAAKTPAPKKTPKPAASATPKPAVADREPKIARRDPFESLVGHEQAGGKTGPLPPGKAGLQVSTLRLDGIVRSPGGMIAVVSNPQSRTYFLREGDQLYDGRVEKIAMDGVSFHEIGKDAFGKPVERQVNKRIYASAGEQQ
jgi:Tfp pilus assembly protein PilP